MSEPRHGGHGDSGHGDEDHEGDSCGSLPSDHHAALRRLVADPVYELVPLTTARENAAALPAGSRVTITTSVRLGLDGTLALAQWLSARGHRVAPHIAARLIRDRSHLSDLLARMQEASIRSVFIVGGDSPPTGEFPDGLSLLRAIADQGHSFEEIGVPAYPEGHASIPEDVLLRDLREKQRIAKTMTTQMSFNPGAVAAWVSRIRSEGIGLPIHLGIPGVMGLRKLTAIAARIGVADSARYLLKHRGMFGHLATHGAFSPDSFLFDLAAALADPHADVRALHVFTMNEVAATLEWQRRMLGNLER